MMPKKDYSKILLLWLPVFFYAGIIFYLSSISLPKVPSPIPFLDKVLHLIEYSILGILLSRAIKRGNASFTTKNLTLLICAICFVYGISDEFHQSFVPGRDASIWDALTDGLGGFLGALIYR